MEALVLVAVALAIAGIVVMAVGGDLMAKQNGRYNCHNTIGESTLNLGVMLGIAACVILVLAAGMAVH